MLMMMSDDDHVQHVLIYILLGKSCPIVYILGLFISLHSWGFLLTNILYTTPTT